MILNGKDLIIKAGGIPIAAANNCKVSISVERSEVANPSDGSWKKFKFGRKSWSVSTGYLATHLAGAAVMVGTTVSLQVSLRGNIGLPFNLFVNNVTVQSGSYSGSPGGIVWDKTRKKFLAAIYGSGTTLYYDAWTGDDAYAEPSDFDLYSYNGITYTWLDNDLTAESLSGNADVLSWDTAGAVGSIMTGSFEFGGNGALTPAALP